MLEDSILGFAIAHALRKRPELVQADMIKLMRRQAELENEIRKLNGLIYRLLPAGEKTSRRK